MKLPPARRPLLLLAVALVACDGGVVVDGVPPPAIRRAPIVNGTTDSEHPAVGLLVLHLTAGTAQCTGTLVGKHTVLTAAHCVEDVTSATFSLGTQAYTVSAATALSSVPRRRIANR